MGDTIQPERIRVGIMGAGIAGCCLAIGLLQNPRLDVQLYEAYSTIRVRGSGLSLHGNAIRAMDAISPEIKQAYFKKSHFMADEADVEMATRFFLASGRHAGELIAELGKAKGRRTVHRAHFIDGLLEASIPSERVHLGKRLAHIENDAHTNEVAVNFDDGSREIFDVVFGAEGVNSPTRKFVLGPDHPALNPVNHDLWRQFHVYVPAETAREVFPVDSDESIRSYCTPLGFVHALPVDLGKTYSISCYQTDRKCREKGAPFNPDLWKGYLPELDTLVSFLEKGPKEYWILQDHDHAPTYCRGHVAIIGDAAHATLPHAGNGAAQAIEDCSILTGIFAQVTSVSDITSALTAFDEVRRPRSQRTIEITRRFGRLYSQEPDEIDLESMRAEMKEGGMYTNGVDMDAQVKSAVDAFARHRAAAALPVVSA